jgi:cbb3-type cytochrome c oxidase subunit III
MKIIIFALLLPLLVNADESKADLIAKYKLFLQNPIAYKQQIASEGKAMFIKRCSYCHGSDGSGESGFAADLRKRISKESALYTIQNGANNFYKRFSFGMPIMIKDENRAKIVAEYISLGMPSSHAGAEIYRTVGCAKCHGENGSGYGNYGFSTGKKRLAPNIKIFTLETLLLILKNGKNGKIGLMQSFHYLSDEELKIVSLYVMSLSSLSRE